MIVGEAYVAVRPDTKGFGPEAEKSIVASARGVAVKAAAAFAAGFVLDKVKDIVTSAIGAASDVGEATTKVQTVFGSAAESVLKFAETSDVALGQTKLQALDAAGAFGNLFRALELSEPQSAQMSVTMTKLAADLASFNNVPIDEVFIALRSGLVGETEPLRRFGVNLNEATIRAEALRLGLIKNIKEALTPAAKAQASYSLILKQTSLAQGDFARTSGGLANQQRILRAQLGNLSAAFGQLLLPAVTGVVSGLNRGLVPALGALPDQLRRVAARVADVRGELSQGIFPASLAVEIGKLAGLEEDSEAVGALAEAFTRLGEKLAPVGEAIGKLRDAVAGKVRKAVGDLNIDMGTLAEKGIKGVADGLNGILDVSDKVTDALTRQKDVVLPLAVGFASFAGALVAVHQAQTALAGIRAAMAAISGLGPVVAGAVAAVGGPVVLIVAAIAAVAAALVYAYFKVEPFRDAVDAVARTIRDVAVKAFDAFMGAVRATADFLERSGIIDRLVGIARAVRDGIGAAVEFVVGLDIPGKIGGAFDAVGAAVGATIRFFERVGSAIGDAFGPLVRFIRRDVLPTFEAIGEFFDALGDRIMDVLRPVGQLVLFVFRGWATAAKLAAGIIIDVLGAAWKVLGPIIETALRVAGAVIETFVRVALPILRTAFDGIAAVVDIAFGAVVAVIRTVLGIIRGIFQVATGILRGDFGKIWEGIKTIVETPLLAVRDFVVNVFEEVGGFLGKLPERFGQIIRELWNGALRITREVLDGIPRVVGGVVDAAFDLFQKLPGRLLTLVGSLADAMGKLGRAIISGIIDGIKAASDFVGDFAKGLANAVIRVLNDQIIQRINDALPNDLDFGFFKVDLPDQPIPRIPALAAGALVRPGVPGVGTLARLGDGIRPELVAPLPPGVLAAFERIGRGESFGGPAIGQLVVPGATMTGAYATGLEVARRMRAEQYVRTGR